MGLAQHLAKRAIFLALTLVIATYITVVIANGGGLIDNVLKAQIKNDLIQSLHNNQQYNQMNATAKVQFFNERYNAQLEARGLNKPFLEKSFRFTFDALTLNLGRAQYIHANDGSFVVADIIGERLPRTLTLFTLANVIGAVFGIWLGLWMARRALSAFDRGMTILSVTTFIVPPWVYGIFFILVLGYQLHIFPTAGWIGVPAPPDGTFAWYGDVLWHMLLPMLTFAFATFGSWSYTTRNLVLQIMDEDFVTAARAKGLSEQTVLTKYVLRAASPPIVTSLALTLISAWQGAIITETVFNYQGIGQLFFTAIGQFDAPVVIALTAIYAYLLVITVFTLDLVYGLLDPRVRALRR